MFVNDNGGPVLYVDEDPFDPASVLQNNLFYTTGAVVALYDGVSYPSLGAYQAGTGLDAGTVATSVSFSSADTEADLRLGASSDGDPALAATRLAEVLEDFDGAGRATVTYKGASAIGASFNRLSGNYTVGGGGSDFATITEAVNALQALGVAGDVTFSLDAGTFNEPVSLFPFHRNDPSYRVEFSGAGTGATTWRHSTAGALDNWVLRLAGVSGVNIEDMSLDQSLQITYGRLLVLDDADEIVISGNTLKSIPGSTSPDTDLIFAPNALSEANRIENNAFEDGYRGVYLDGVNDAARAAGNVVQGNSFSRQYHSAIFLRDQRQAVVDGNTAEDASSSSPGYVGIEVDGPDAQVTANRVQVLHGDRGVRLWRRGPVLGRRLIANNMIAIGGANAIGGLVLATPFADVRHNSVRVTSANSTTAGLWINGATGTLDITNQGNVYVNVGGGPAATFNADITASDSNVYDASGSTLIDYTATPYATLAAFQTATGFDAGSVEKTPVFALAGGDLTDLHLTGASDGDADFSVSANVLVPEDIDGDARPANTYRGADEAATPLPLPTNVTLAARAFLLGALDYVSPTATMRTGLNAAGRLELTQPFSGAPWNYAGTEAVASGFFAANPTLVDWVYLRLLTGDPASPPMTVVAEGVAFIGEDGLVQSVSDPLLFPTYDVPAASYYVELNARNHVHVLSAVPIDFSTGTGEIDFATTPAFGTNSQGVHFSSNLGLWPGDGDANGQVTPADALNWQAATGYDIQYDYNLDGVLSPLDMVQGWVFGHGR
ncbi:MAG: right-handed parallel beta-helix repeat-containing protein [Bacteroidota bacterium]